MEDSKIQLIVCQKCRKKLKKQEIERIKNSKNLPVCDLCLAPLLNKLKTWETMMSQFRF